MMSDTAAVCAVFTSLARLAERHPDAAVALGVLFLEALVMLSAR